MARIRLYKTDHSELAAAAPADHLRAYVHEYTAWRDETRHLVARRHVPSGRVPLIFNLHARVRERKAGCIEWSEYESFVSGLHDTSTITESAGPNRGIQVDFGALGARMFLGLPLHTLTNRSVAVSEIFGASHELSGTTLRSLDVGSVL